MITRVEVTSSVPDARAMVLAKRFLRDGFKTGPVIVSDVYSIEKDFQKHEQTAVASLLTHPVTQRSLVNRMFYTDSIAWAIEIGFLPGVTDNIASTAKEIIADALGNPFSPDDGVYSSRTVYISEPLPREQVLKLAGTLHNPLIERITVKSRREIERTEGTDAVIPKVLLVSVHTTDKVDLNVSDEILVQIGKTGIRNIDGTRRGTLALTLRSMHAIRDYFRKLGRNPTDIEIESLAQTWSEHCKHSIFSDPVDGVPGGIFKTYIKGATDRILKNKKKRMQCASVFTDNSGAIVFDRKYLITHKVETHNSPSALDPFGGAVTGIVGVNRDAIGFGLGAKPIMNMYGFCVADPESRSQLYRDAHSKFPMLTPRRILDGVVAGINAGGNCSGIPTPLGFVYADPRYIGKPLVFAGTVGIIPKKIGKRTSYIKKALPGDLIVVVGGRVGIDGVHGATFSSEALSEGSPVGAVQIGDPITQKKLSDALINEARTSGLYRSITDNGAGGLSCSVAEMAKESGGCTVELSRVPLKYPGLSPWQIWISESQERMTIAVPPSKRTKLEMLCAKRGVEMTVIGKFTDSGSCVVLYEGNKIMDVDMKFLHDGRPVYKQHASYVSRPAAAFRASANTDMTETLLNMIGRLNLASFAHISSQYDYEVQGTSVIKPLVGRGNVNGDTVVLRPILTSDKGIALSFALYPSYSEIDAYRMATCTIDTAVRNIVAAGADPETIALLDNFCWCSADDPIRMGQLVRAAKACFDTATAYQTPFISGKDSMFNDFRGYDQNGEAISISVPPTLLISSIGLLDDCRKAQSPDFKIPGDNVYLLGTTFNEMGGSEYAAFLRDSKGYSGPGWTVPRVRAGKNLALYRALFRCIRGGIIASAQSVARGGLAVAVAKAAIAGKLGADLRIFPADGKVAEPEVSLFSESQGRLLVTVTPGYSKQFEKLMKGMQCIQLGEVTKSSDVILRSGAGTVLVRTTTDDLHEAYTRKFRDY